MFIPYNCTLETNSIGNVCALNQYLLEIFMEGTCIVKLHAFNYICIKWYHQRIAYKYLTFYSIICSLELR